MPAGSEPSASAATARSVTPGGTVSRGQRPKRRFSKFRSKMDKSLNPGHLSDSQRRSRYWNGTQRSRPGRTPTGAPPGPPALLATPHGRPRHLHLCREVPRAGSPPFGPLGARRPSPLPPVSGLIGKVVRRHGRLLIRLLGATSPGASAAGRAHLRGAVRGCGGTTRTLNSDARWSQAEPTQAGHRGRRGVTACFPGVSSPWGPDDPFCASRRPEGLGGISSRTGSLRNL